MIDYILSGTTCFFFFLFFFFFFFFFLFCFVFVFCFCVCVFFCFFCCFFFFFFFCCFFCFVLFFFLFCTLFSNIYCKINLRPKIDLTYITKTCLYNIDPLKLHFYIVKLGFTGVYIIFLISSQKHRLWVLVRTASLSTHNLCFDQKYEKYPNVYLNIFFLFFFFVLKMFSMFE